MKWIGAVLILTATTSFGYGAAKRLRERSRQLREMKVALQALEAEIVYGLTPLIEAATHISRQMSQPLSTLFASFANRLKNGETSVSQAWNDSLADISPHTSFGSDEIEVLKQFGITLGRHDRDHQQKQIKLTLLHLEREETEAKDAQLRYGKMMKSLGFLAGLLLTILLL